MSQAFISYHRAQRKLARLIAHRVAADGHAVWWDRGERPGDSWSEAVSTALANSACVIVIWSRQAASSPWVLGEATAGYGKGALVNVLSDKTQPPSPFDRAPVVDIQGWEGESVDLAWIRLREPLREKMNAAEKAAAIEAPLPPGRPAPVRVGFSSAAVAGLPPPPPHYSEERRGGAPISTLVLLAVGGLGAAGWYYRDQVQDQALHWQAALTPPPREYAAIPEPAPPTMQVSVPAPITPTPLPEEAPVETGVLEPVAATTVAAKPAPPPVPTMTRTYEDWRDTFVPAPILRSLPRAPVEPVTPTPVALEAQMETAPGAMTPAPAVSARLERLMVQEGRFIDVDGPGSERKTDLWFAPDKNGYGLFLGVTNGARMRVASGPRISASLCATGVLRRNPIAVRELQREGGICLRSSDGTVSAWRVETVGKEGAGSVLRMVAVS